MPTRSQNGGGYFGSCQFELYDDHLEKCENRTKIVEVLIVPALCNF
jgi:hypothetical protein